MTDHPAMAGLPERLVGKKELRQLVPVSDQTTWRWEHETDENGQPKFPKRIRLGPGRVAWKLSQILAWIEAKVAETDAAAAPADEGHDTNDEHGAGDQHDVGSDQGFDAIQYLAPRRHVPDEVKPEVPMHQPDLAAFAALFVFQLGER